MRINTRRLANSRIEFALQHRVHGGGWSERVLPRARKPPTCSALDRWLSSSPLAIPWERVES